MDSTLHAYTADFFPRHGLSLKLLRILPMMITTILFVNRMAQFFAITTFMPPYMPIVPATSHASKRFNPAPILKVWLRTSVSRIFPGVLAMVMVLRLALLANILVRPEDFSYGFGRIFYSIGLLMSFAHLPLAPKMLQIENAMKSPQTEDADIYPLLGAWFKVNNIRIWAVDFPLWAAAFAATLTTFKL